MKWFWNLINNEQLKLDNEALVAENRLLKAEMFNKGHLFFTNNPTKFIKIVKVYPNHINSLFK